MRRALLLALLACGFEARASARQSEPAEAPSFARSFLSFPRVGTRLAARDLDGDGDLDLLFAEPGGFGARLLRADGTYADAHDAFLPLPSARLAWDLAELSGGGRSSIVAIVDGKEIRAYSLEEGPRFGAGELLLEIQGYLPRSVARLDFVRDVDGDGRSDLIVPAGGRHRIHLGREGGGFAAPIEVAYEARIDYDVGDPERLDSRFAQSVRIPWFRIEDIDGDGRSDLVSETEDALHVHLATPALAAEPTWTLDLEALRAERPARSGVDLDDLLANIDLGIEWRIADLDGRAPNDLLLQVGSVVRVHLGASRGGPDDTPDQILKLSGTLLRAFVRDVQGDPLPDLQLLRGEKISLGTVIRWLVLPGSLDFDLFTYQNERGTFSRRPTRQNRVTIEIPRLLSFMSDIDELEEQIEAQEEIPARRYAADPDGLANDVVDVVGHELVIYRDRTIERGTGEVLEGFDGDFDALIEELVLRDLDAQGEGGSTSIDLAELKNWQFSVGASLRAGSDGSQPDERVALQWAGDGLTIHVADLDADGRPDFVLAGEEVLETGPTYVVQVLVRRP